MPNSTRPNLPRPFTRARAPVFLGIVAFLCLGLIPAQGRAQLFITPSGSSGSDGPLSASADFTIGSGTLTVTLTNTLAANVIRSPGQALSDISFTLSNAPGTLSSASASGQLGDIGKGGKVTYTSGSPGRWVGLEKNSKGKTLGSFNITGNTITLETIGGGKPTEMILPSIANGGTYSNLNPGGLDKNFSPDTIGPATFTLNLSGVTSKTTVTGVIFSFGTGPDTYIPGKPGTPPPPPPPPPPVPAPPAVVLLGLGTILVGTAHKLRSRWRTPAAA